MCIEELYTTREESIQLLKMGVPANTADCYFGYSVSKGTGQVKIRTQVQLRNSRFFDNILPDPCWSIGQLLKLLKMIFGEVTMVTPESKEAIMEAFGWNKELFNYAEELKNFKWEV